MDGRTERRRRTQNRILRALPPDDFLRLSRCTAPIELQRGDVLTDDATSAGRVYFMMSGACSAVLTTMSGDRIEVASISCDGVTSAVPFDAVGFGIQLIVTVDHTSAVRLAVRDFDAEMDRRSALRHMVTEYYRAFHDEIMLAVACNRLHSARARCCRKLLTLADRTGSDTLHVTHAALALMLGVTRPSVTLIALDLKRNGIIDYTRDAILLVDRRRLERLTCECYHVNRDASDRGEALAKKAVRRCDCDSPPGSCE
jgi:CRP-like cAMP-binding protein